MDPCRTLCRTDWLTLEFAFSELFCCGHVTRLKLSMGPTRGPYSLYPRHVRASMLPPKKLSTHTMHFKWHHRNLSKMTTNHWKRIMNEDTHLLLIPKNKNVQKYQNFYLATQMEHDQSSYFCRGHDDFCWGPALVGPTLVTGPFCCVCRW